VIDNHIIVNFCLEIEKNGSVGLPAKSTEGMNTLVAVWGRLAGL
jgi:hypothetical protein